MSDPAPSREEPDGLPPPAVLVAAAAGTLPSWARVGPERRGHMQRVADLMDGWAQELALPEAHRLRWRAAGFLHDALRDADPDSLRSRVPPGLRDLPPLLLHGPAAAERLRSEGVADGSLLMGVAFHTVGHPDFDRLGVSLYLADFLEPGRDLLNEWRAELRARMPHDSPGVLKEVLAGRIRHQVSLGAPLRPETWRFWNRVAESGGP